MKMRLLPDMVLKVVLSGLLDATWGKDYRSTIVRFFVYEERVRIGVGEGNIKQWEIDALRSSPIRHEWFKIEHLNMTYVPGIKYVPEKKVSGMPRGLIPLRSADVHIFISDVEHAIFPAYRCFDIDLGERRTLSIISPRTIIRDVAETTYPPSPKERYRGKINNVEVKVETLNEFFQRGYGIGILRKVGRLKIKSPIEAFPLLGKDDIRVLLKRTNITSTSFTNRL